jgi:hypothetical protein
MYNTALFIDGVMPSLIENITSRSRRKTFKGWLIHTANARPHHSSLSHERIRAAKAEWLPHPAYSTDIAPSDFFLFGFIKGKISDCHYQSRQDLLKMIAEIFSQIDKPMLINVFESWIKQLL